MKMMTMQEVFVKVYKHLIRQNAQALDKGEECEGQCLYRTPNGKKCAAGCLILDKYYEPGLEGKLANHVDVKKALRQSGVPAAADHLVQNLQVVHDRFPVEHWRSRLDEIAGQYKLSIPEI